jgi:hypothetical protein
MCRYLELWLQMQLREMCDIWGVLGVEAVPYSNLLPLSTAGPQRIPPWRSELCLRLQGSVQQAW